MKGRGGARYIGILGWRQVTPMWADDLVRRHYGRRWSGCMGMRVMLPPEGHRTAVREGGAGQE